MRVCTAVLTPAARGGQLFTQEKEWIGAWRTTNSKASFSQVNLFSLNFVSLCHVMFFEQVHMKRQSFYVI